MVFFFKFVTHQKDCVPQKDVVIVVGEKIKKLKLYVERVKQRFARSILEKAVCVNCQNFIS